MTPALEPADVAERLRFRADHAATAYYTRIAEFEQLDRDAASLVESLAHQLWEMQRENQDLGFKLRDETAIVDRVWRALGVQSYADAGGKEISELVCEWKARAEALERSLSLCKEALEPFAAVADEYSEREDGSFETWRDCHELARLREASQLANFRRARAAFRAASGDGDGR